VLVPVPVAFPHIQTSTTEMDNINLSNLADEATSTDSTPIIVNIGNIQTSPIDDGEK